MIPGSKAPKAVRACTIRVLSFIIINSKEEAAAKTTASCLRFKEKVNVERFFHGETIVYR